jgi:predicted metal-dependent hydrolase
VRSQRKTTALRINADGTLEVRTDFKTPNTELEKFVKAQEKWIAKHLPEITACSAKKAEFVLDYDNMLLFRGKEYPLRARPGFQAGFDGECFYLTPGLAEGDIRSYIIKVYKNLADSVLRDRTSHFATLMAAQPLSIRITSAKTRWGSCNSKGAVNYSWRLVLAAPAVIDYVVVHELSHLAELNHSPRFWRRVATYCPDYAQRRAELRLLQQRLATENWD